MEEKVLMFEVPMLIGCLCGENYKKEIGGPIFGFKVSNINFTREDIIEYLKYLAAVEEWDRLGNDVDLDYFMTKEGITHSIFEAEIQMFIEETSRKRPFSANIYQIHFDLVEGFFNDYLVDASVAQKIREEGILVDVLNTKNVRTQDGGGYKNTCRMYRIAIILAHYPYSISVRADKEQIPRLPLFYFKRAGVGCSVICYAI